MMLALLLAAQAPAALAPPARYDRCVTLAARDPAAAEGEASRWMLDGGGFLAHQCLGIAYTNEGHWAAAAAEFEMAARAAEVARDDRSSYCWARAGNAWPGAKDTAKARADLDAALAPHILVGLQSGEAYLERARAFVAAGDLPAARAALDHAIQAASSDPLAWLLSATLARRMHDLPRARTDIAEALKLSSDDASVQLEAGNIAATDGDEAGAKAAWGRAVQLQPGSAANKAAIAALAQFDAPAKP
ncbi:hypothetical protein BH10PSE15_BH10PSE15_06050 [soil metagenome]